MIAVRDKVMIVSSNSVLRLNENVQIIFGDCPLPNKWLYRVPDDWILGIDALIAEYPCKDPIVAILTPQQEELRLFVLRCDNPLWKGQCVGKGTYANQ